MDETNGPLYSCAPDVLESQVGDCLYLLDSVGGVYFELNETGMQLWQRLKAGPADRQVLIQLLMEDVELDPEVASADLNTFLEQMVARRLILEKPR